MIIIILYYYMMTGTVKPAEMGEMEEEKGSHNIFVL